MQTFDEFWESVVYFKLEIAHPPIMYTEAFNEGDVNGCGAKGGIDFPDKFWGVSVETACNGHDVDWKYAKCRKDLIDGNHRWRRNMERIIDKKSANRFTQWLRLLMMARYYRMVKLVGTPSEVRKRGFV